MKIYLPMVGKIYFPVLHQEALRCLQESLAPPVNRVRLDRATMSLPESADSALGRQSSHQHTLHTYIHTAETSVRLLRGCRAGLLSEDASQS